MKYKVGDKVRFIGDASKHHLVEEDLQEDIKKYNNIFTLAYVSEEYVEFEENRGWCIHEYEIELIRPSIIKKSELQNGDIVTYRNGNKRIVNIEKEALVSFEDFNDIYLQLNNFNKDLFYYDDEEYNLDIIKVYRPETEETFYTERTKEVKEMTLKEVCEKLGYEIKIIKE